MDGQIRVGFIEGELLSRSCDGRSRMLNLTRLLVWSHPIDLHAIGEIIWRGERGWELSCLTPRTPLRSPRSSGLAPVSSCLYVVLDGRKRFLLDHLSRLQVAALLLPSLRRRVEDTNHQVEAGVLAPPLLSFVELGDGVLVEVLSRYKSLALRGEPKRAGGQPRELSA